MTPALLLAALFFDPPLETPLDLPHGPPDDVGNLPEPPPHAITFAAVGDIMLGTTYSDASGKALPPEDGARLLEPVTPVLAGADVAFGNLEGPFVDGGVSEKCGKKKTKSCWAFRTPTRYGRYLQAAGLDMVSLANNHAMDFGDAGRQSTTAMLDGLGIAHSGAPGDVATLTVKGQKIALIAFATYVHSHNLNRIDEAVALVRALAASHDLVVVSFHGGAEGASRTRVPQGAEMFYGENRGDLRTFTHAVVDAGADLVLGHGPHVVRGMEVYRGRLIAYSLGNFATYGGMNLRGPTGLSLILEASLCPDGHFLSGRIHPVKQIPPGGPVPDPAGEIWPVLRALSQADFGESAVRIAADGRLAPPSARAFGAGRDLGPRASGLRLRSPDPAEARGPRPEAETRPNRQDFDPASPPSASPGPLSATPDDGRPAARTP